MNLNALNPYSLALFAHVIGAIGIFAGMGVWTFASWALRQAERVEQARLLTGLIKASSNLVVASIFVLGVAGFYMAITVWGSQATWIVVATITFVLLAPLGLLVIDPRVRAIAAATRTLPDGPLPDELWARTRDPLLATGLSVYVTTLLGIVFIMTNKPTTSVAILVAVAAAALGLLISLPLCSARAKRRVNHHAETTGQA
ncbi:MAG TPA: DUF2269 family protein [Ktedonobacterales bacterium]|jgi:uncharacterized membrane protein|nr:DUF2269 family protein [Ktedonobacterales bacterium]